MGSLGNDNEEHCNMIRDLNMTGVLQELQLEQLSGIMRNSVVLKEKNFEKGEDENDSEIQELDGQFVSKFEIENQKSGTKRKSDCVSAHPIPPSKSVVQGPSSGLSGSPKNELARKFKVGETWAYYDAKLNLPTSYVVIEECKEARLLVSWLKPIPGSQGEKEWIGASLPVACGRFEYSRTGLISPSFLSHSTLSAWDPRIIIPWEGETWAIYKDWDLTTWSSHPEKYRTCEYEYVEVLSYSRDTSSPLGVRVAYLDKVAGLANSFKRRSMNNEDSFLIPAGSLYRFSHRVPSVRKTSNDPDGSLVCVFEFELRALPLCFFIKRGA